MTPDPRPQHPVVAAMLGAAMFGLRGVRRRLLPQARGRVLEIGVGTGLNFPHYREVTGVWGVEPDPHMLRRAEARVRRASVPITLCDASAEALPYDDHSFDTAVVTFVLCTIPDPEAALRELCRVLRPEGALLLAEHTASRGRLERRVQTALTPAWRRVAGGCHLDRDVPGLLGAAGFSLEGLRAVGPERVTVMPLVAGTLVLGPPR